MGDRGIPASGVAGFSLDSFFPHRLSVLTEMVSRALAAEYAQRFKLTVSEWRAMAVLACYQPLSANGICVRTNMDKVRVTRAVAKMLEAGLVLRDEDPEDRRCVRLRLSRKGLDVCRQIIPVAQAREAEILSVLDAGERAQLDSILRKLTSKVSEGAA